MQISKEQPELWFFWATVMAFPSKLPKTPYTILNYTVTKDKPEC